MTRDEFIKHFKVGDKIKQNVWNETLFVEIIFIGDKRFFAMDESGNDRDWEFYEYWLPYTPPKKKKTIKMAQSLLKDHFNNKISPLISGHFFASKEDAEKYASSFGDTLIQWPLVVNGVEQWIEVEVEE